MAIRSLPSGDSTPAVVPVQVGLLLIDGFALLSYASVTEPLRVANQLSGMERYRVRAIPASGAAAVSSGGVQVPAAGQVGEQVDFDLVIVVAAGDPYPFNDVRVLDWLRHLSGRGVRLGGVAGGCVVLASARLLKGYRATLHWQHARTLADRHADIVVEQSLHVVDRDRLTSAGGTAPLDLMHAMLVQDCGPELARGVDDWLQNTGMRPPLTGRHVGVVERYKVHQPALIEALAAMETHLSDPLGLHDLARLAEVGVRHLTRLFQERLGLSPMDFYRELRLREAQRLLRTSGMNIGAVALATGFSSASHFASVYRRRFACRPGDERAGAKPLNASSDTAPGA